MRSRLAAMEKKVFFLSGVVVLAVLAVVVDGVVVVMGLRVGYFLPLGRLAGGTAVASRKKSLGVEDGGGGV